MDIGKQTENKIRFDLSVDDLNLADKLDKYDKDGTITGKLINKMCRGFKAGLRKANAEKFNVVTGSYQRSIWYSHRRNGTRATVYGGQLSNIYEKRGARIMPIDRKALSSQNNPRQLSGLIITKGDIYIPPRPWFFAACRNLQSNGTILRDTNRYLAVLLREKGLFIGVQN